MRVTTERVDSSRAVPDADGRHESANGHHAEPEAADTVVVEPVAEHDDAARMAVELPVREPEGVWSADARSAEAQSAEVGTSTTRTAAAASDVEAPAAERPAIRETTVERPTTNHPAVELRARERPRPLVQALLFALPAILPALWAAAFVPLELALVVGALAALPVALVALPWLITVAVAAALDR